MHGNMRFNVLTTVTTY